MSATDHELVGQFSQVQAQDASRAPVHRQMELTYSAALRQVRPPQRAEEGFQAEL